MLAESATISLFPAWNTPSGAFKDAAPTGVIALLVKLDWPMTKLADWSMARVQVEQVGVAKGVKTTVGVGVANNIGVLVKD